MDVINCFKFYVDKFVRCDKVAYYDSYVTDEIFLLVKSSVWHYKLATNKPAVIV